MKRLKIWSSVTIFIGGLESRQTLIMITHNEEIAKMADRVVVMKDGNLK